MSLGDKLKLALQERTNLWASDADLPGVHLDVSSDDGVSVVFDGKSVLVPAARIDSKQLGQSFGQAFFEGLCQEFGKELHGSYDDAKRMANKVALKAMRLPHVHVWLVHTS